MTRKELSYAYVYISEQLEAIMSNSKEIVITVEGLAKLENELEELKVVRRADVAEKIKQALAFGDLSENAEYDEAKNEQAFVESRIVQIEKMLKIAKVVDDDDINTDVVSVGTKVRFLDVEFNEEEEYTIVGPTEAEPAKKRLSYEAPIGSALMGKAVGDEVEVVTPAGLLKLKVLAIAKYAI